MIHWRGRWSLGVAWLALMAAVLACSLSATPVDETQQRLERGPLVVALAPANGSVYAEGTRVALYAIAQDTGAGVARITFRMDDIVVGEVTADDPAGVPSLFARADWTAVDKRRHLLTVEAFRADGSLLGVQDVSLLVTDAPGAAAVSAPDSGPEETPDLPPTDLPTPDVAQGPLAQIAVAELNVRAGPGTGYEVVGVLAQGAQVPVTGRSADGTWLAVSLPGGMGWVFAELVIVSGDLAAVPVIAAP
ncbi:MAG: SH3 domain-containing protein [Anaerolineae bacterium]|nr:SH3 domain-containing protein [Anaerolineae bacterium]